MHTKLQGIESNLKVVWIVNHQNKFITIHHSYIIFVIFLDIKLKKCNDSQPDGPTVSDENVCPRKLDSEEFLAKQEILSHICRKNLLDNVFQPKEGFTFPTKQFHGCFRSFNFKLWTNRYPFLIYSGSIASIFVERFSFIWNIIDNLVQ